MSQRPILTAEGILEALAHQAALPQALRPFLPRLAKEIESVIEQAASAGSGNGLAPESDVVDTVAFSTAETQGLQQVLDCIKGQSIQLLPNVFLIVQPDAEREAQQPGMGPVTVQIVAGDRNVNIQGSVENTSINTGNISVQFTLDAWTLAQIRARRAQQRLSEIPLDQVPEPTTQWPEPSYIPFLFNPGFTGRDRELKQLAAHLAAGQAAYLTGVRGMGKTQLAVEFAYRYAPYFEGGVFWLNLSSRESLLKSIDHVGGSGCLNLWRADTSTPSDNASLSLETRKSLLLGVMQENIPRLLILDGVEDFALLSEWLPKKGGYRVLVTTPNGNCPYADNQLVLPVGALSQLESVRILRNGRPDLAEDDPALAAIARELGGLPLALVLAANFLRQYRQIREGIPQVYLEHIRAKVVEHQSLAGRGSERSPLYTEHERHVWNTFAISYNQLAGTDPVDQAARQLLEQAAWLAPGEPFPELLLRESYAFANDSYDALLAEDAVSRLVDLGLVQRLREDMLLLPRLLGAFVECESRPDDWRDAGKHANALFTGLLYFTARDDPLYILANTALKVHIVAACKRWFQKNIAKGDYDTAAKNLVLMYPYQERLGDDYESVLEQYDLLARNREKVDPDWLIACEFNAGNACRALGRYKEAAAHFSTVAEEGDTERLPDLVSGALGNYTICLYETGDITAAQKQFQQALQMARQSGNKSLEAKWLNGLSLCAQLEGNSRLAWHYLEYALAAGDAIGEADFRTLNRSSCLLHQAYALELEGAFEQATALVEESLQLARAAGDKQQEIHTLSALGMLMAAAGRPAGEDYIQKSLQMAQESHLALEVCYSLYRLADCQLNRGETDLAQANAKKGLDTAAKLFVREQAAENAFVLARAALLQSDGQAAGRFAQVMVENAQPYQLPLAQVCLAAARLAEGKEKEADEACQAALRSARPILEWGRPNYRAVLSKALAEKILTRTGKCSDAPGGQALPAGAWSPPRLQMLWDQLTRPF